MQICRSGLIHARRTRLLAGTGAFCSSPADRSAKYAIPAASETWRSLLQQGDSHAAMPVPHASPSPSGPLSEGSCRSETASTSSCFNTARSQSSFVASVTTMARPPTVRSTVFPCTSLLKVSCPSKPMSCSCEVRKVEEPLKSGALSLCSALSSACSSSTDSGISA